jgi:hypothetical protein
MEELSKYKIFRTRTFYDLGEIFIVLAGIKNLKELSINTEWYYLVKHKNVDRQIKKTNKSTFNITSFQDEIVSQKLEHNGFETIEECWKKKHLII